MRRKTLHYIKNTSNLSTQEKIHKDKSCIFLILYVKKLQLFLCGLFFGEK